jgi:hypothetical protein
LSPILACATLVLAIGLQLALPRDDSASEKGGLAIRRPRLIAAPRAPEFALILRAPAFAPDRRPAAAAGRDASDGGLGGYAALGSVAGRGVAAAVLSGPAGSIQTLRLGEVVDGWRLVAVDRVKVIFERNSERRILAIGAAAQQPASASAATAANP